MAREPIRNCPDCGVAPGKLHKHNCDVEVCAGCGTQALTCRSCSTKLIKTLGGRLPWTGVWPMNQEAEEAGFFCYWSGNAGKSYVSCDRSHPKARPDLNRFAEEFRWNPLARKYERRPVKEQT